SYGDWSSDVCSSDLTARIDERPRDRPLGNASLRVRHITKLGAPQLHVAEERRPSNVIRDLGKAARVVLVPGVEVHGVGEIGAQRSEERRVGKECGCG